MMMNLLDLFSGIGGFSLGLERSGGFKTVAFCEIDSYCRAVLKEHWPDVPCYDDVRTLTADALRRDGIAVDAICGGFPCQDLSVAGKRAGIEASRSGLWGEYSRIISELRPKYAIVENVTGILSLGLGRVLGDLASLGYDAIWDCIPASAVGAPHRRDRFWLISYPKSLGCRSRRQGRTPALCEIRDATIAHVAYADASDEHWRGSSLQVGRSWIEGEAEDDCDPGGAEWGTGPGIRRIAHGIPSRVDRLGSLGNAVVPQIPEIIGKAILNSIDGGTR